MVNIYSASNTSLPIGKVMDYNNTNPSRRVALYRVAPERFSQPAPIEQYNQQPNSFARAIYGDGPYSLLCPNSTTEILAQNIDLLA